MPDDNLIERALDAFEAEYRRLYPAGGDAADHDDATRSAIAAVVELVEAERTRRIVAWLRDVWRRDVTDVVARAIESEFGERG